MWGLYHALISVLIVLYTIIYHYIPFVLTAFHRTCVLCGVGSEDRGSRAGWNSRRWVYRISSRELEKLRGQNGRQLDGTWCGATLDVTNVSPGYVLSFVDIVRPSGRSKSWNWHQMGYLTSNGIKREKYGDLALVSNYQNMLMIHPDRFILPHFLDTWRVLSLTSEPDSNQNCNSMLHLSCFGSLVSSPATQVGRCVPSLVAFVYNSGCSEGWGWSFKFQTRKADIAWDLFPGPQGWGVDVGP